MKKFFIGSVCFLVICLILGAAFGSDEPTTDLETSTTTTAASTEAATEQTTTELTTTEEPTTEVNRHSNLEAFIEKYNSIASTPIENAKEIDISSDEYYRTEYRLGAFQNAPAFIADLGDATIEIVNVNYEGMFGSSLRIYATVKTLEEATDVFESYCKACDPEITQEVFDEFYEFYSLDSEFGCNVVIESVSGYVNMKSNGESFEIMLDGAPGYFNP